LDEGRVVLVKRVVAAHPEVRRVQGDQKEEVLVRGAARDQPRSLDVEVRVELAVRRSPVRGGRGRRRRNAIPIPLAARLQKHVDVEVEFGGRSYLHRERLGGGEEGRQQGKGGEALHVSHRSILSAPSTRGALCIGASRLLSAPELELGPPRLVHQ